MTPDQIAFAKQQNPWSTVGMTPEQLAAIPRPAPGTVEAISPNADTRQKVRELLEDSSDG